MAAATAAAVGAKEIRGPSRPGTATPSGVPAVPARHHAPTALDTGVPTGRVSAFGPWAAPVPVGRPPR